jgi:DNA recombination protein RmuC
MTFATVLWALLLVAIGVVLGVLGTLVFRPLHNDGSLREARDAASAAREQAAAAQARADALASSQGSEESRRTRDEAVLRALGPVSERLASMQKSVQILERDRVDQYSQLNEQLQRAARQDAELLRTTSALSSSLRDNGRRGTWGEVQLRRVVEAAGMLRHVDFDEQVVVESGRPDLVVWLPGGKSVAVDAKVPLEKLLEAHRLEHDDSAEAARERTALLTAHAKALRAHVNALGDRRYQASLPGSPDLVVCFLPTESVLSEALAADGSLMDDAFSRGVVLASPATLLAVLKGLAVTWRQELVTQNARSLFDEAQELHRRLTTLSGHVDKLGSSLRASVEGYNKFVGALQSRVAPSLRRINELDPGQRDDAEVPFESGRQIEAAPRPAPENI